MIARPRLHFWLDDFAVYHDIHAVLNLHYTNSETPLIGILPIEEVSEFAESFSSERHEEVLKFVRTNILRNIDYLPVMQFWEPKGLLLCYLSYPSATLRVVDVDHLDELPGLPPPLSALTKAARVSLIKSAGPLGVPTSRLLGEEPGHTWTWFFQRAELARQLDDSAELERLLSEVYSRQITPGDPSEFLVFLEAAIRTKHEDRAQWIIREIQTRHMSFIPRVRTWLTRFQNLARDSERGMAAALLKDLPQ